MANLTKDLSFFDEFRKKRILILGDIMLDTYIWGSVNRISPEAPVPVVLVDENESRLGGAGNVAMNIKQLGAVPLLISVTGNDKESELLNNILAENHISSEFIISSVKRKTTQKTRIIANHQQQIVRIDHEETTPVNDFDKKQLINKTLEIIPIADAIIFSDYDKGLLVPDIISQVIAEARKYNIPTIVDPKRQNFLYYHNATLFKPNLKELQEGLQLKIAKPVSIKELQLAAQKLVELLNIEIAMITLSDEGVYINDGKIEQIVPSHKRNVYDVSGAGDTVAAVAALSMACGFDSILMAELTNLAGGIVCEKVGVAPVSFEELKKEYALIQNS